MYTAADVLAKLLTVDGAGSGLDADFLDGLSSAAFAAAVHTHASTDITDFMEASQDVAGAILTTSEGTGDLDWTYTDGAGTLTAVVKTAAITTAKLGDDQVTFAKLQNVTDARLLGRNAGSAGDTQEITLGTNLSFAGTVLNATSAGGGGTLGTTTLDFGASPVEEASVAVTGQAGIVAGSHVEAWFAGDTTADNTLDEHNEGAALCPLVAGSIVVGTGFTITAQPIAMLGIGQFTVHWRWT